MMIKHIRIFLLIYFNNFGSVQADVSAVAVIIGNQKSVLGFYHGRIAIAVLCVVLQQICMFGKITQTATFACFGNIRKALSVIEGYRHHKRCALWATPKLGSIPKGRKGQRIKCCNNHVVYSFHPHGRIRGGETEIGHNVAPCFSAVARK